MGVVEGSQDRRKVGQGEVARHPFVCHMPSKRTDWTQE